MKTAHTIMYLDVFRWPLTIVLNKLGIAQSVLTMLYAMYDVTLLSSNQRRVRSQPRQVPAKWA